MKKIAPTLQSWTFDDGKWSDTMNVGEAQDRATAELRALLACAKALRKLTPEAWVYGGTRIQDEIKEAKAALARLDRTSGKKS
jgi:hypothetical protein